MSGHFAIGWLLPALALAAFLEARPRLVSGSPVTALLLCSLILGLGATSFARRVSAGERDIWHRPAYEAALWVQTSTPEDTVLAMKDAGIMGYFSRRRVVNLDGLVNNMDLQVAMRDGALGAYLHRMGVGYLVQHSMIDGDPNLEWRAVGGSRDVPSGDYQALYLRFHSKVFRTKSEAVTVHREDEVYRSEPFMDRRRSTRLLVWRLPET